MLALSLSLMSLELLNVILKSLSFLDKFLLVGSVLRCVLSDDHTGFSDVHLQLFSLGLAVCQNLLVSDHILLHVINDLSWIKELSKDVCKV